jgi:hypothetical protein
MAHNLPSERLPVVAALDPAVYTTQLGTGSSGHMYTDIVDMSKHRQVMFVVSVGAFGTAGMLVCDLVEAATSYVSIGTTISGKSATALLETGLDLNKQVVLNLNQAELTATYKWAACKMTLTCGDAAISAVGIGIDPRYADAFTTISWGDLSSVDEIVT